MQGIETGARDDKVAFIAGLFLLYLQAFVRQLAFRLVVTSIQGKWYYVPQMHVKRLFLGITF